MRRNRWSHGCVNFSPCILDGCSHHPAFDYGSCCGSNVWIDECVNAQNCVACCLLDTLSHDKSPSDALVIGTYRSTCDALLANSVMMGCIWNSTTYDLGVVCRNYDCLLAFLTDAGSSLTFFGVFSESSWRCCCLRVRSLRWSSANVILAWGQIFWERHPCWIVSPFSDLSIVEI